VIQKLKPKLTLLVGPAGCGKTHACTQAFEDALRESQDLLSDDLLFILPTAEHRARTIDLTLRGGSPGFFQRRITTFDRALKEFLKLGGFDFATDVTRRIILKEILNRTEFQYFKGAVNQSGFLELLGKMVVELKEYLISPEEFKRRLVTLKKKFPEFELKYADLEKVYEAYERELKKRDLTDQRDSLKLLEEGLERGEFTDSKLSKVWIDGFSDFSKLQLSFIEFLTRHADEVTVTLTVEDDPLRQALFQIVSETQTALEDLGFEKQWMKDSNYRISGKVLQHLEKNLFREGNMKKIPADPSVQVFEATGLLGEIEMIAREIKRLVRAKDYHFSDVAVLFRTTDPYLKIIQSVCRKFQIPVEIHERLRLRTNPIARTLASFFEILLGDWSRSDIFNFLKSSYVRADYEVVCELELRALQKGIFKDRRYWLRSFPQAKPFQDIAYFEDEFLKLKSVDQFAVWVKMVMSHFGLLEFPDSANDPSPFDSCNRMVGDEKTRTDRAAARRILLLLEEMKRKSLPRRPLSLRGGPDDRRRSVERPSAAWSFGAGRSVRRSNDEAIAFAEEFLALVHVDLFSVHARDKNRVQVYNVSLARQKEYKVVFLAGLLEKQFPIQIKEDPVFSDAERRTLNEKGEVLKERLPRQAFERYLFYLAVTRARERLILSYPRFDLEGKEALASFYVEEVRRLFSGELPGKKQHVTDMLPAWEDIAIEEEAEELVIKTIWSIPEEGRKGQEDRLAFAFYNYFIAKSQFKALICRLLEPVEGVITDERIKARFSPESGTWSPTYLEEYAECPYRFFSHRHLGLETQTEGIDIRRRGTILHDVLEQFFTWRRDQKKGKVSFEEAQNFCMKKFKDLWEEEPLTGDRYYKVELERKKMQEMILQILRMELIEEKPPIPGLMPRYFEYEFKDLILKGEGRDVLLRGKIDRIDLDPDGKYALVIDYKTGKKFDSNALANGTLLQLPLYLLAVREKLGLKPLGGHLYLLSTAKSSGFHHKGLLAEAGVSTRKGVSFNEKEFDEKIKRSVRFVEKFVEGIERAEIPVRPRDCVPYCSYSSICRIEKWRLEHIYRVIEEEDKETLREKANT